MNLTIGSQKPRMTSREIAALTGSPHDAVLKTVRRLVAEGVVSANETPYKNEQNGQTYAQFSLSFRDTMVVVSGYSSELRAKIIDRWQELEAGAADPLAALPAEQRALVALMVDNAAIKAQQAAQALQIEAQADSIKRIEAKQSAFANGAAFFTVIGYGVHRGISFGLTDAAALGRAAGKLSREAGIAIDKVSDPRFGKVNSYHESMLDAALIKLHGGM